MRSIARILFTATSSIRVDALISVKQKLGDSSRSSRVSICAELYQLAYLSESFSQQRLRSNKDWIHQVDILDREGGHTISGFLPTTTYDPQGSICGIHLPCLAIWMMRILEM